jgi:hypothetical protein
MDNLKLDFEAARIAQTIIETAKEKNIENKITENLITKTLGVLEENGVYACMLYLCSRSKEKEIAKIIRPNLFEWNKILDLEKPSDRADETLKFVANHICHDLDILFLVKELWERTLIYSRYGAKARGVK